MILKNFLYKIVSLILEKILFSKYDLSIMLYFGLSILTSYIRPILDYNNFFFLFITYGWRCWLSCLLGSREAERRHRRRLSTRPPIFLLLFTTPGLLSSLSAKMRECISIHIGQAGIQVGNACWELYCLEHGIQRLDLCVLGNLYSDLEFLASCITVGFVFIRCGADPFCASPIYLSLCFDLFSEVDLPQIVDTKSNVSGRIFTELDVDLMMILNFICANCAYQKNYFEISNHIYCFAVTRTLQTELFPSIPDLSLRYILCCLELLKPYSLLQLDGQMPSNESREAYSYKSILILFTFDVGLIRICYIFSAVGGGTGSGLGSLLLKRLSVDYGKKSKLGCIVYPSPRGLRLWVDPYNSVLSTHSLLEHTDVATNLNRLVSQVISSLTASLRFDGAVNVDVTEFQTNLVPYPRIHFMLSHPMPPSSLQRRLTHHEQLSVAESPTDVNAAVATIKTKRTIQFVDWCPTGFKCGINYQPPTVVPGG
ncbi:unnamed protein product [Musa acuminata subsp. malaccensis]|uniref:(wild Malaysian banana) hypothetical protein n=1 Tax=Musa acuminata subsp. malaccensis TaxID=214687 RepID=A0A8D7ACF1_MUSAM|nr:unnamed protein product [Musa acuminata subsp. malaccensis]